MVAAVNLSFSVGNPASVLRHSAADGRLSIAISRWVPISFHHSYKSKKVIGLRRAPFTLGSRRMMPKVTRNSGSSSSGGNVDEKESLDKEKVPFGYTRKDVLLIGVGVTLLGVGLKTGLEFVGVDPLQAGNAVQLVIVLGLTVGWISTYMFRVANKDMTYAQQLRDYENKVMEIILCCFCVFGSYYSWFILVEEGNELLVCQSLVFLFCIIFARLDMERRSNCTPAAENGVLDVKPLRSLAPMFPVPFGFDMVTQSKVPPLVCISPLGSSRSGLDPSFFNQETPNKIPFAMNEGATRSGANGSIHTTLVSASTRTPRSGSFWTAGAGILPVDDDDDDDDDLPFKGINQSSGKRGKRSQAGSSRSDAKRKRLIKSSIKPLPLSLPMPDDPRESVDMILMTFDSLRRRLLQVDEAKDESSHHYLKAGSIMAARNVKTNVGKRVGSIPGVEVGDIFYFRFEMNLIGLHAPSMAGIDYLKASVGDKDEPIAICVVSSGGYENEEDDVDVLIYSGQGGSGKHDKKPDNQKLEKGNLALDRSFHRKNQIRVVRSAKDIACPTGKIYIYDGLYKIESSWTEKNKAGFNMFKYKLLREPGQPDGIAIWKMTQKWKENPSSRGRVILPDISSGAENIPVCLVNDVDDERGPNHFVYVTSVKYPNPTDMKPLQGCMCLSVCLPGDMNCSCAHHNEGDLPYNSMGLLVRRKPLIYECCSSCQCTFNCRNRVTLKGIRLHFEVFRTSDRGWGLRSWDPIRAGTFICEYTGEVIDRSKIEDEIEEDEYIFQATHLGEKAMGFNCRPELLEEAELSTQTEVFRSFPITLSAKNSGNIARFINHSCSPNIFWQPVLYDHGDEEYPHIMFFAMKHIPPMTELTYDYGPGGSIRNKKCLCAAPNCRGYFG